MPLLVAVLLVGRDGVVNHCANALSLQVVLERITVTTEHREDMKHMVYLAMKPIFGTGQDDGWIGDVLVVIGRDLLAATVLRIEIAQFHVEHRCLQLVYTTVATLIREDILARRAVIAQRPA